MTYCDRLTAFLDPGRDQREGCATSATRRNSARSASAACRCGPAARRCRAQKRGGCRGSRPVRCGRPRACRGNRDRPRRCTVPPFRRNSSAVATAFNVTPAQATSASSSMSPEQACNPLPPVAGCSPASTSARPVLDPAGDALTIEVAFRLQCDQRRIRAVAVLRLERRLQFAQRGGVHLALSCSCYCAVRHLHRERRPGRTDDFVETYRAALGSASQIHAPRCSIS